MLGKEEANDYTKFVCQDEIDIYKRPDSVERSHPENKNFEITIGDLHGNAIKLLFMLCKHGIVTHISTDDYTKFVDIYKTPIEELNHEKISQFNSLLDGLKWADHTKVRLIGDEFADRGSNDYFTLKIIHKMCKEKISFEILLSNHGVEFIQSYEKKIPFNRYFNISYSQIGSMINLGMLLQRNIVLIEEINSFIEEAYKPNLKLLSYSSCNDIITVYSHAAIGLLTIHGAAQKMGLNDFAYEGEDLPKKIDEINKKFKQEWVDKNQVYKSFSSRTVETIAFERNHHQSYFYGEPVETIMWNRLWDTELVDRPLNLANKFKLQFVHGHDSGKDVKKKHIFNLDNILGKKISHCDNNIEQYTVFYASSAPIKLLQDCMDKIEPYYSCSTSLDGSANAPEQTDVLKQEHSEAQEIESPEILDKSPLTEAPSEEVSNHEPGCTEVDILSNGNAPEPTNVVQYDLKSGQGLQKLLLEYFTSNNPGIILKSIEKMLENGANPNLLNEEGDTYLHQVFNQNYSSEPFLLDLVQLLLKYKANPNIGNKHGEQVWLLWLKDGAKKQFLDEFLKSKADLSDIKLNFFIYLYEKFDKSEINLILNQLVAGSVIKNEYDSLISSITKEITPRPWHSFYQNPFRYNKDLVNAILTDDWSVLDNKIKKPTLGLFFQIIAFLQAGGDSHSMIKQAIRLGEAVFPEFKENFLEIITLLIKVIRNQGKNIDFSYATANSPLYHALSVENPCYELVELLLENGASPNVAANSVTCSPFYNYIYKHEQLDHALMELMLTKDAEPGNMDVKQYELYVPIFYTIVKKFSDLSIIKLLLDNIVDINDTKTLNLPPNWLEEVLENKKTEDKGALIELFKSYGLKLKQHNGEGSDSKTTEVLLDFGMFAEKHQLEEQSTNTGSLTLN